jgi:hypothetical protein
MGFTGCSKQTTVLLLARSAPALPFPSLCKSGANDVLTGPSNSELPATRKGCSGPASADHDASGIARLDNGADQGQAPGQGRARQQVKELR